MRSFEERRDALADFLNIDGAEIEESYGKVLSADGGEYLVVDDDEADEEFADYQRSLWDDLGIESFSESFQEWIMDNAVNSDWFEEAMDESNRFYCEDIMSEGSSVYGNRLVEECYERNLINDEDFEVDEDGDIDYTDCKKDNDELVELLADDMSEDDPVEWYRSNFGDDDFMEVVKDNDLVDVDAVIDEIQKWDGRGPSLASYDGEENESGDFFIYRVN